ncbi:rab3 GTPase-activating protein non-catalytic subunit isoform X2 [Denticeps clupeoides]|uniref:rab3 GTPase-activating protein non-catalytic subunit isoform X2 n=1 Tax=Denticeps clupeoides TaxID=299321 RepID=UPI0010A41467|nr:rab3 GTPase-activating protein non-catalytic subunit isoform X2 [Denticeps clupeoides]
MSCCLTEFCRVQELRAVRGCLFSSQKSGAEESRTLSDNELSWDDSDWGSWESPGGKEDGGQAEDQVETLDAPWLQDCVLSLSPCSDLLVIARETKAVFLSAKWRTDEGGRDKMNLTMSWSGVLSTEEGECVSSVICIPLASQKRSSTGRPDWTCVVVGFTSGYVRFYTEGGVLLLSQLLHEDPVLQLKCRTYETPRHPGVTEQHEELSILYPAALVTIDGFSLFQSLRACRNQVARAAAGSDMAPPPPLAYKKWGLQDMESIVDHSSVGLMTLCAFDQMKNASVLGGFHASVKGSPPAMNQYITVGSGPYTGFYFAVEGSSQPLLSHVALAVATKLTSALFSAASGWLGWKQKNEEEPVQKQKPKVEPATPLPVRFGLPDSRRHGEHICLSPCNTLAGVTDDFGRVTLLDVTRGIAIRMWKGYRDAQLGWVQVCEVRGEQESPTPPPLKRHAHFLVIYAPRRGILEVWATQHGPRVGAFTVGKHCRLLYSGYRLMGLNSVTSQTRQLQVNQVCLLDPLSGVLRTVTIPFHLALSDKKSERAKDLHLLKRLASVLRSRDLQPGLLETEAQSILLDIKHPAVKKQALESLMSNRNAPVSCLITIIQTLLASLEEQDAEVVDTTLIQTCSSQLKLLQLYTNIHVLNTQQSELAVPDVIDDDLARVGPILQRYLELTSRPSVSFAHETEGSLPVSDFLSQLQCDGDTVLLVQGPDTDMTLLGRFVFWRCVLGQSPLLQVCDTLQHSGISPQQLLSLLMCVWLSEEKEVLKHPETVNNLHTLMTTLSSMKGAVDDRWDGQSVCPWWQQVRTVCLQSDSSGAALLAALVAQSAAKRSISTLAQSKVCLIQFFMCLCVFVCAMWCISVCVCVCVYIQLQSDWEVLSLEAEQWAVCVRQLEDALSLQTLLNMSSPPGSPGGATLRCSVKTLLESGRGGVADAVGKQLFRMGVAPDKLKDILQRGEEGHPPIDDTHLNSMEELLVCVCQRFPDSLSPDLLFAHCCWECVVQWNKDPEVGRNLQWSVEHLKCISGPHIQLGIASMMWSTFIVKRFSAVAFLVEKVGKAPKDRLCRRDVGMGDAAMTLFLGSCVKLLQVLMEADSRVEEEVPPLLNVEEVWGGAEGPASLAELALEQKGVHYPLVQHHWLLASLLHAAMTFNLKVKPLSLFDSKGKNALFRELSSIQLMPSGEADPALVAIRQEFLLKLLSGWAQALADADSGGCVSGVCVDSWLEVCLDLAELLQVNPDLLRRHLVCEMYSQGLDLRAEEVMRDVEDLDVLGSQLLVLAGQRLSFSLLHTHTQTRPAMELLARLPPTLCTWLKAMDPSDLRCPAVPLSRSARLVGHVIEMLPESNAQYSLALHLLETVETLGGEE